MLELESINNVSEVLEYKASLINNQWYGIRNNKKYPFKYDNTTCDKISYIYSSPTNDYWPIGTCRKHNMLKALNVPDYGFWTPFREGLTVKGTLIDNYIHVDWNIHQIKAKQHAKTDSKRLDK